MNENIKYDVQVRSEDVIGHLMEIAPAENITMETRILDIIETPLDLLEFVLLVELSYRVNFKIKEFLAAKTVSGLVKLIKSKVGEDVL